MGRFIQSTSGRLMSLSIATALVGGGAATLMQQPTSLYVMTFTSFAAVVGCVASLQLAVEEHPGYTAASIIALPILLFLYVIGQGFAMSYFEAGGYAFMALGAAALAIFLRSFGGEGAGSSRLGSSMSRQAHAASH